MTLSTGYWVYEQMPDNPAAKYAGAVIGVHLAGMPYHTIGKASQILRDADWWSDMAAWNRWQHKTMVQRGMPISKSSARHFARTSGSFVPGTARFAGHSGARLFRSRGLRLATKVGARFVPGLGWAMFAYDAYTVANMILDD